MDQLEAIRQRHSVRRYQNVPLKAEDKAALQAALDELNAESGLHMQLVTDEPKAFDGTMAHYGHFSGVTNYIAVVGKKGPRLEEDAGYYGEKAVLAAQALGLNTCWVALTFKKVPSAYRVEKGEKLEIVISVGYGATQGNPHPSKTPEEICDGYADGPDWYRAGVDAALLAPTAMNQQKFRISLAGDTMQMKPGRGFYTKMDLGIAMLHFEIGAGKRVRN